MPDGVFGIQVFTVGPYELDGELAMDFLPQATESCDLCASRTETSKRPFCAEVCPTQALSLLKSEEILKLLKTRSRIQVCKAAI